MSERVLLFVLHGVLAASACVAQQNVVVKGRLFDDRGQPLAGVTVGLTDDDEATATSDRAGVFRLEGGRVYDTDLVVRSKGWARMAVTIPEDGDVGDLTLARAQHLTGRVLDVDGNAIAGARVLAVDGTDAWFGWVQTCSELNSPAFRSHTTSDARGAFLVPDAVRGVASVYVSARGFGTTQAAAAAATPIEITLHRSATALPASAALLPQCRVHAVDAMTAAELTSFSAGEFWDGDVAPGKARRCSLAQVDAVDGVVTLHCQGARGVEVRAAGYARQRVPMQRGDLVVRLVTEAGVRGMVVDPSSGAPLPGVDVRVALGDIDEQRRGDTAIEAPVEARTDADGRFAIAGLGEGDWTLVATHAQRHRGPPTMVRLEAGKVHEGVRLESPKGASLAVELSGQLADPRCMLRLSRITPNVFDSSLERRIDGALAIRDKTATFYGLDAGDFAVELLVPQPPRFGLWRKVTLDSVGVAAEQQVRATIDLAAGPRRVRGILRGAGACPPMQRLLVVAERKLETRVTYQSLFLCGPMARPADNGSFLLLAEPGGYTLLVVDVATRVILGRRDGVEVGTTATEIDAGELPFRSRSLEIDLRGAADRLAAATFVEVRAARLWPTGLGKNQGMPADDVDSKIGVQLVQGVPARPVWIPTCEVAVTVRPSGEWVTVAAGEEAGVKVALRAR
ncbi:MAG TPA: carboxypeptidase-like regulatory domain-containing protein [Planctomycetota bacterium]|nr:carboxypeptidase-like regulatory domain-containing protein [Planctomycetota bacterium]